MFIGHLPASYVLTTGLLARVKCATPRAYRRYLWIGLIAGVLPDIDLVYFYLIDHRQHLHHTYWTHLPIYWAVGSLFAVLLGKLFRRPMLAVGSLIGFSNLMLHLVLDTIAARIQWLYPFSKTGVVLFPVPSRFGWWVWNYLLHWTFALEVTVTMVAAVMLYYRSGRRTKCLFWRKWTHSPDESRPIAEGGRSMAPAGQGSAPPCGKPC